MFLSVGVKNNALLSDPGVFRDALYAWTWGRELTEVARSRAEVWYARFLMVGGMPSAVLADAEAGDAREVRRVQHDLLATLQDDFGKYAGPADASVLTRCLKSAASQLGEKFVYARVLEGTKHRQVRHGLELLAHARVCHIVEQTAANGLPLGGEVNPRNRKVILLDIGLVHALLGTPATQGFPVWDELSPRVRGALTEQAVGQQLLATAPYWEEPHLYDWQRGGGRPGEIDYVVQVDDRIVPVEARSGAAGSMKSLHQFMYDKRLSLAVRIDANPPSVQELDLTTTQKDRVAYRLLSLPQHLVWRLNDVVRESTRAMPVR